MKTPNPKYTSSADGTNIAWYDFGGNGPDVLLGHATGFCAGVWWPVVEELHNDFRCVAYDLRGHGMSSQPKGTRDAAWDWSRYADDAAATIDAAALEAPFSVGHSCGAATAVLLEERSPGTFAAMIGFEPVMFLDEPPLGPDEERDLAVRTLARRTSFDSRSVAIENFATRGPFVDLDARALDAYIDNGFIEHDNGTVELRCDPKDEAAVYVMASAHTGYVELTSVTTPLTVVHGANSRAFDETTMRAVAGRAQNGRYIEMAGVGHFGALEEPELFAEMVRTSLIAAMS